jgi:hypothetical protein
LVRQLVIGLSHPTRMVDEYGTLGGMRIGWGNRITRRILAPMSFHHHYHWQKSPFFSHNLPYKILRDWIQFSLLCISQQYFISQSMVVSLASKLQPGGPGLYTYVSQLYTQATSSPFLASFSTTNPTRPGLVSNPGCSYALAN